MTSPGRNVLLLGISERVRLSGAIVRILSVTSSAGKASFQASGKKSWTRQGSSLVINGNGFSQVGCGGICYNRKPDGASWRVQPPAKFLGSDEQPEASNVVCDYTVGPVPWKSWFVLRAHSRSCKRGCQDCFVARNRLLHWGGREADVVKYSLCCSE